MGVDVTAKVMVGFVVNDENRDQYLTEEYEASNEEYVFERFSHYSNEIEGVYGKLLHESCIEKCDHLLHYQKMKEEFPDKNIKVHIFEQWW